MIAAEGATAGSWYVHPGTIVRPDGVDQCTVIGDGTTEIYTREDPAHLMIALARYLEVERIEVTAA